MMDPKKLKNKVEAIDQCGTSSSQAKDDDFKLQVLQSNRPLLGLKLTKHESLLAAIQEAAAEREQQRSSSMNQPKPKTFKAASFPISSISIGSWKRVSGNIPVELTAKIYYGKKKLLWEILNGKLKNKMLISWSDITAIRAVFHPDQSSTLEIELSNPPLFFLEREPPQPSKHTHWEKCSDFTNGQAQLFRRHTVTFPPGKLDKPYENLLKCDQNLVNLSIMQFPTHPSPHFDPVPPLPAPVSDISEEKTIVSANQPQLQYLISPIPSASPLSPPLTTTQELDEMAAEEYGCDLDFEKAADEYGCDFEFLSKLFEESNPIPPSNTSYGMSAADHEQVVMTQNDTMFPPLPSPPSPHIEGAGCSPGSGDEGLAQILNTNHGANSNDDQVKPPQ